MRSKLLVIWKNSVYNRIQISAKWESERRQKGRYSPCGSTYERRERKSFGDIKERGAAYAFLPEGFSGSRRASRTGSGAEHPACRWRDTVPESGIPEGSAVRPDRAADRGDRGVSDQKDGGFPGTLQGV